MQKAAMIIISSTMTTKSLGYKGEDIACRFLKSKGYEIIGANFTVCGGEIDVIARLQDIFVFAEVKTRTSFSFGEGCESVNSGKLRRLRRAAQAYLQKRRQKDADYRFDIIDIQLNCTTQSVAAINHIEDIEI